MQYKESPIQVQIVEYLQSKGMYFFSVPNEHGCQGKQAMLKVMRLKAMGLRSGAPDLVVLLNKQVVFLEVKSKKGVQSDSQKNFQKKAESLGHVYLVVKCLDDVMSFFDNNIIL